MSAFGSCLALALTLGSLPPLPIGDLLGTIPSVSNLTIATVAPRSITEFNFSAVGASLFFPSGATFQVNADLTSSDGVAGLTLNVTVDPGIASFVNTVQPGTCLIDKVVVSQCSLRGRITGVVYPINGGIPEDFNAAFLDGIIQAVAKYINNQSTCGGYADLIAKLVTAIPDDEPATLPPAPEFPSMCDLRNSPLMNMATDVISHLPTLFGMRFGLSVPTANAVRATIVEVEGTHGPLTIPGTTDWIQIPANTGLSMDLVFTKVLCPAANSIEILDNVTVMNIRLTDAEGNSVARLFDDIDSGLGTIATDLLRMLSRSVPPEDAPILLTIPTHDGKTAPFYTMAIVASASLILGLSASFVAWRRHRGKLLLDQHGQPVSRLAFFIGDAILIVGCCSTIVCFAWSNQTGAATVRLGGTFDLYNFGLADSVRDMWSAGLYALSFFIALFCGFYPYFKLLSILLFSVVLQRPQSKVLHFIDLCGKFSLLDSFVMIILAEGLTVPGIVQVEMGPSFWVFLGATVSSMALGNYATHGWRAEVPLADSVTLQLESSPVLGGDRMPRAINYRGAYVEDMAPASPIRASTAISLAGGGSDANLDPNRFRPIIAGLCFVMMVVVLGLPALFGTIEFQNGGVGALVTGATNRYTLVRLIGKCPTGLIATAYISIFIMPLLFAAGYRKSRVLAAWCAPDAFLLACVAALFQLNQFVVFVLGSAFKGVITINAALLWPIYALGGAVALLWLLIVGLLFR